MSQAALRNRPPPSPRRPVTGTAKSSWRHASLLPKSPNASFSASVISTARNLVSTASTAVPSDEMCQATVQCIAAFTAMPLPRSLLTSHLHPTQPRMPCVGATQFNAGHLGAFCAAKRSGPAEFSHDLMSRMMSNATPSQVIDAETLRTAASKGPFASDWQRIISLALEHTSRAEAAQQHKDEALLRVAPPPPPPASATTPRSARSDVAGRRTASASPRSSGAAVSAPSAAAVAPAPGDEYRDHSGRRRLFLPTVEHPPWSQHAEQYTDHFDSMRRDGTGRSLLDATQQQEAAERSRFANSGTHLMVYDCGGALEMGITHKAISRGAAVVDLSRLHPTSFNPYFSERTVGNEKLPMSMAMVSRFPAVPPNIRRITSAATSKSSRSSGGGVADVPSEAAAADASRRINESIAAVVQYLDAVAR